MTAIRTFAGPEDLGDTLAAEILAGIEAKRIRGERYLLGCPTGRTPRSTYAAMARHAAGQFDFSSLILVLMDDYLEASESVWHRVPPDRHYSCERFARDEIAALLSSASRPGRGVRQRNVWLPNPATPEGYDADIEAAGGIDLFIVASGASDGHVAFNPPGTMLASRTRIVRLADTTRQDNLGTFPAFRSLDEVPTHGVTVGLATIADLSRSIRLLLIGSEKASAIARVRGTTTFDPAFPATFVHEAGAEIWVG